MRPALSTVPPRPTNRVRRVAAIGAAVFVAVAVVLVVAAVVKGPRSVPRVTVANPTAYALDVDATDAGRHGWTGLGIVGPGATEAFQEVVDQGDRWVLRFSYGGVTGGELELTRQELAAHGWRIDVPPSFGDHIRAAGVTPPPR